VLFVYIKIILDLFKEWDMKMMISFIGSAVIGGVMGGAGYPVVTLDPTMFYWGRILILLGIITAWNVLCAVMIED
jgi:hypothetical protein